MSRRPKALNPDASWSSLFGATVRRLRLGMRSGRPLTQAELGRQIGYSDATVGAVERAALRPDLAFMEGCERALPAAGMLRAMFAFVLAEWDVFERTGPEAVKSDETPGGHLVCMSASGVGWLIQATAGSLGGVGGRANRCGLAA